MSRTNGIAIALAWPETMCKQTGSWYDALMRISKINIKGYYQVGHAAVVLVDEMSGECSYYDFGRYHAPPGFGRVRSAKTDHDLSIRTRMYIDQKNSQIINFAELLEELYANTSTHGTGPLYAAAVRLNIREAAKYALRLQDEEIIAYGPFAANGTNCSRFVNSILKKGGLPFMTWFKLQFPWMLTPTPMWNVHALGSEIFSYGNPAHKVEIPGSESIIKIAASS